VTTAGHLTSTYTWTIQKSASPSTQMVPVGSSASVSYAITTTKSASGTIGASLDGKVCVTNKGKAATQGLAISDQLTEPPSKTVLSTVAVDVSAMPALAALASWCYPYTIPVPAASIVPGGTYKDTARVTITNYSHHPGVPTGPSPTAAATLPGSPTVVDGSVTINDSNGQTFNVSSGGTVSYSDSFSCPGSAGAQTMLESNTATIISTSQSSTAAATIHCGAPTTVATALSKTTIGQGTTVTDQATISGAAPTAGGTISYHVYSDNTCTTLVADATPASNAVVNGVAPASQPVTFNTTGGYWWAAVYSGDPDANTLGSSSDCAAEPLTVQPNDFSISAVPDTLSVLQGDTGTSTISTAVTSGSPGTVDLSVSGVPSGATATLDAMSVTAGSSATLTVSTGTAAAGTYTLSITGTEGSAAHATTVALTVKQPPAPPSDFSISADPGSLALGQGASGASSISTAVTSGSAGTVDLSVSGVPSGATATLAPTSVTAGGSSTLTVSTGTAAAGSYTLIITGTEGSVTHATTVALTIAATAPAGITNGGFETGDLAGWSRSGASETVVSSGCHGGIFCAMLGSASPTNGDSSISQTFAPPSGTSQLSLFYKQSCPDTVTFDWALVTLKDNTAGTTSTPLQKTCTAVGAWTQVTASVTAGHSYTLTLTSHDDNYAGDPTYTLFDDVTLN
jgi:hypothetical protein